jgi:hypothetical protein
VIRIAISAEAFEATERSIVARSRVLRGPFGMHSSGMALLRLFGVRKLSFGVKAADDLC